MKTQAVVSRTRATSQVKSNADSLVYSTGLVGMGVFVCAVGLWAIAGLVGGLIASGGPVALAADWVKAVFGI